MASYGDELIDAYQIARAMRFRYQLDQFEIEALASIMNTYDAARSEILGEFEARFSGITDWRSVRMDSILGEVEAMTAGLRNTLVGDYGAMMTTVGTATATEAGAAIALGGLVTVTDIALSPSQLSQFFVDTPICGHKLTRWVDASFDATVQQEMRQAINVGVIKGEGTRDLVNRLEDGFGMARNEATTLTRTFVGAANNAARDKVFKANADIVSGWKWHTCGDNLVCRTCIALHGQEFEMDSGPSIPKHPRCRCSKLPVLVPWKELGINMAEFEDEADKWMVRGKVGADGEIIVKPVGKGNANGILSISQHSDADGWWSSLSDAEKRATTLGPGRASLLDSGQITMKDLVNGDYNLRTLSELRDL